MIDRAAMRNFKSLRDVAFDLGRLTVLVGENAGGKTSVLQALALLDGLMHGPHEGEDSHVRGRPGVYFRGETALERFATRPGAGPVRLAVASGDARFTFEATLTGGPNTPIYRFEAAFGGETTALVLPEDHGLQPKFFAHPGFAAFGPAALLRLDAAALARPGYVAGPEPALGPAGENLAVVLADLAAVDPDRAAVVAAELRQIIPVVRRLRMPRAEVLVGEAEEAIVAEQVYTRTVERRYWGHALEIEMGDAGFLAADLVGEGVLLALGLLTVLHGHGAPRLVLFDDLERGLHPAALAQLVGCMRRALEARADLQLVCTSHSPAVLSLFGPDEVRVVRLGDDGFARVVPLADDPEWSSWRG